MPGMYNEGDYDLAGFAVGIVEKNEIIDGREIKDGDVLLGLKSSGPHSNGYSLIRKIIESHDINIHDQIGEQTIATLLMEPTRLYVKSILDLKKEVKIKAMSHITGGGLTENLPRSYPNSFKAQIDPKSWKMPSIFEWIMEKANLNNEEMYRTFNCGIGFVVIVDSSDVPKAREILEANGEEVTQLGQIEKRESNENLVTYI